jgi:hypothetical protein
VKKSASRRSRGGPRDYPITCNQLPTIFNLVPRIDDQRRPRNDFQVAVDLTVDPRQAWTILRAIGIKQLCAGFGTAA